MTTPGENWVTLDNEVRRARAQKELEPSQVRLERSPLLPEPQERCLYGLAPNRMLVHYSQASPRMGSARVENLSLGSELGEGFYGPSEFTP